MTKSITQELLDHDMLLSHLILFDIVWDDKQAALKDEVWLPNNVIWSRLWPCKISEKFKRLPIVLHVKKNVFKL